MKKTLLLTIMCFGVFFAKAQTKIQKALSNMQDGYILNSVELIKQAAAENDIIAQYYFAQCYEYGIGVEKNSLTAFGLYRRAAERGLGVAMTALARCYRDGLGIQVNTEKAEEWQKRFVSRRDGVTLPNILEIYNIGVTHPENFALDLNNNSVLSSTQNNIESSTPKQVVQQIVIQRIEEKHDNAYPKQDQGTNSDVDLDIPFVGTKNDKTFAVIIANETYSKESNVPFATNDGKVFKEYCERTLGLPKNNIHLASNATLNDIRHEIQWLKQVMAAYKGEARIIFYYAGHGIPDEAKQTAYLLPVDGYGTDVNSGYALSSLYEELSGAPSKSVTILLDACFSGAKREGDMLASARAIAIKVKQDVPTGNLVVLSAAQGDETAFPFKEQGHGMFTYFLLKKLQETRGEVTLKELADYVKTHVSQQSVVINGKPQTPSIVPSKEISAEWQSWTLK